MTDADEESRKPTKWQVRQWLAERRADRSRTLPTPEELRRQLGWRLRPAGNRRGS